MHLKDYCRGLQLVSANLRTFCVENNNFLFPSSSSIVGLPKVKRDKYSVFNFLTVSEPTTSVTQATNEKIQESSSLNSKFVTLLI